jgi:hypothetical protein
MEALGTVASVAGILSLAIQGIQAIQTLHDLYQHCTDEAAQQFLHELGVSARILCDVKELCDRSERHASGSRSQIRLASLQVQVEDCTADLETWLKTAKRIDSRSDRLRRFNKSSNNRQRSFSTLLNAILKGRISLPQCTHDRRFKSAFSIISEIFRLLSLSYRRTYPSKNSLYCKSFANHTT